VSPPSPPLPFDFDAVIPAGGAARRLGGTDKPMVEIGGATLLDRVIEACHAAGAVSVTVVGPERPTRRPVHRRREEPPGGGPVAAIAAALPVGSAPWVAVLAADLPFVDAEVIHSLCTTLRAADAAAVPAAADGALLLDPDGREQWLAAVYRRAALEARLTDVDPAGMSLRRLVTGLRLLPVAAAAGTVLDCDTWEDVEAARRLDRRGRAPLPDEEEG
jgi:molybdopterin-guanine dinucleotide biosynthesis protein A